MEVFIDLLIYFSIVSLFPFFLSLLLYLLLCEWWGAGTVICLGRGVHLHVAQLMPLSFTVSFFSKI